MGVVHGRRSGQGLPSAASMSRVQRRRTALEIRRRRLSRCLWKLRLRQPVDFFVAELAFRCSKIHWRSSESDAPAVVQVDGLQRGARHFAAAQCGSARRSGRRSHVEGLTGQRSACRRAASSAKPRHQPSRSRCACQPSGSGAGAQPSRHMPASARSRTPGRNPSRCRR